MFHILKNPKILISIQRELETIMPEPDSQPKMSELERLPYLVRCSLHFPFLYYVLLGKQTEELIIFLDCLYPGGFEVSLVFLLSRLECSKEKQLIAKIKMVLWSSS